MLFNKFTKDNADIKKYSLIKLHYLFCIIGINDPAVCFRQAQKKYP